MWPIVVSILAFMVFYTWFQFNFRKTETPYEPSRAMQERADRAAESNLYGWYSLEASRLASHPENSGTTVSPSERKGPLENQLPSQIVYYIPRRPILVPSIGEVTSEKTFTRGEPLTLSIEMPAAFAKSPDFHLTSLYKDNELILLAEMRVENEQGLQTLPNDGPDATVSYAIDTEPIENEQVRVRLFTEVLLYEWSLERR